ncbi:hypothetical protein BGZ80_000900 [Entomortierella chlamydospora]|uniref:Glycosyltransferase 61 catalytic domain-containing protein n=1 Tax=Entomortierella chlamydospora TaxID=101097 RepID=A0A9P6N4W9_9FUNG|nr:hypothetical protein BGZ80_000900 [Entomortierella chlamydospora]
MLPHLDSTMKRFGGTGSSWLLRQAEYLGENLEEQAVWEMDAVLPSGQEIVLKDFEVVSPFQALPPKRAPICFDRAVIGLGSQCGLDYCAKNTPTEIYQAYSEQVQNHYWPTVKRWNSFLENRAQEELERQQGALGKDVDFSPTKCLQTARYYNFEGDEDEAQGRESSPNLTPAHDEPILRRGEIDPDSVDRLLDGKRRRRPVVAIIERRRNRAILNLDLVISTIVKSGHFRLKVLNYDQGCGIPETAYLMRDVNILISSHGNALGGSLWMPSPSTNHNHPVPVVISIDSTRYYERWFQWTTTAMGQRFILHRCGPAVSSRSDLKESCALHRDLNLARKILEKVGLTLDEPTQEEDLLALTGAEFPLELWARYRARDNANGDGQEEWLEKVALFLGDYWKNLARYADPDRLLETLEKIRLENEEDNGYENTQSNSGDTGNGDNSMRNSKRPLSYLRMCMQGRCCGPDCEGVMNRNVVGTMRAYDQDISEGHWGEFLPNEEQAEFVRSGGSLKSWIA